jgi:DNA adenine methylase
MIQAPFPWFGGKSRAADLIWQRLGNCGNYVEPFAGSLATLLARPHAPGIETVNDLDGFIANFWRAAAQQPDEVACQCDWPVNECDLHARHLWLLAQRDDLVDRMQGDPDFCDAKIAGWWVWGICSWIGSGWCSGNGPWVEQDGKMVDSRQLPHLSGGQGVNRQLPHLSGGRGVNRQLPHLGDAGRGVNRESALTDYFAKLAHRLRHVRVCCGDWSRVLGDSPTVKLAPVTAIVLDPPYDTEANRQADLYTHDAQGISAAVREWALDHGDDPRLRIVLCGYEGEHDMPGWSEVPWKAKGGYGSQVDGQGRDNAARERLWFSPHCLPVVPRQASMFDEVAA